MAGVIAGSSGKYGDQQRFSASTRSDTSSVRQKRYDDTTEFTAPEPWRGRRAVEVRVQDRNPKPTGAQRAREMQCQGALADAAFAGAHGHKMAHSDEPVGDAGALFGNLLEDPGSSVADDVVIALHVSE